MQEQLLHLAQTMKLTHFLGPFIGAVSPTTAKLWIQTKMLEGAAPIEVAFTVHENAPRAPALAQRIARLTPDTLGAATVTFENLKPDTRYFYKVWANPKAQILFPGLHPGDLYFKTFPADEDLTRFDFMLLSCHAPEASDDDGYDVYKVWNAFAQIRRQNDVRFAIMAGDQIYGDHIQEEVLREKNPRKRVELYLDLYAKLWRHPVYKRALCSLPAYLMWDDHDITDGWGSRADAFEDATSCKLSPEWKNLFVAARECFTHLQASRNPPPLLPGPQGTFDFCFELGGAGFVMADLRSRRNSRIHQIWSDEQFEAVKTWVAATRDRLDSLFFVSPVVFTHGWPNLEKAIRRSAPVTTVITQILNHTPVLKHLRPVERLIKRNIEDVAGFRDDLEDAWASDPNKAQAEKVLDYLFSLQNPTDGSEPIPVVILSGDIHAAGYSMLYSGKPEHTKRPVIEHICSSPIASKPVHWMIEGLYQENIKSVPIGVTGSYTAQVSHHHCNRNVVVLSYRCFSKEEQQLKVKYYLEDHPQPEVIVSDLKRVSHWEAIDWDRRDRQLQDNYKGEHHKIPGWSALKKAR